MKLSFKHNIVGDLAEDKAGEIADAGQEDSSLARGLSNLYSPESKDNLHVRDIADVLAEMGIISVEQLEDIRAAEKLHGGGDIEQEIIGAAVADVRDILKAKTQLCGYKFKHVSYDEIDKEAFEEIELGYIRANHVMPIAYEGEALVVATDKPADVFAIDDIKRLIGKKVDVVVCSGSDIEAVCDEYEEAHSDYNVDEIISDMGDIEVVQENEEDLEDLEKSAGRSPVIKFVNYLLSNAVHEKASDIHIEPKDKYTKIRMRIDGVLFDSMQAPAKMHPAVVSRIKIMSNLDISERRVPQDGKISVIMGGRGIDLRISILPTSHGEKVVIRILDSRSIMRGLDESGMEEDVLRQFRDQVALPHGILLVTGPTGSGKSTTLYSALGQMDGGALNISTVEDPVEYDLEFCNQVQVKERAGLTFASALRSLLRQDPDIIMIGEIRDDETALIAVQAALTGHLVLSTLHTNDAPSSISRLVNIGIDPYLIAASLNAVLAQRLVRCICDKCKEPYKVPQKMLKHLESSGISKDDVMRGVGCESCRGSGYSGRLGIYELLVVDEIIRETINKDTSVDSMKKVFAKSGSNSLFDDGMMKVKKGLTTIEEVLRVTEVTTHEEKKAKTKGKKVTAKVKKAITKDQAVEAMDEKKETEISETNSETERQETCPPTETEQKII